jgi:hypothetical protein
MGRHIRYNCAAVVLLGMWGTFFELFWFSKSRQKRSWVCLLEKWEKIFFQSDVHERGCPLENSGEFFWESSQDNFCELPALLARKFQDKSELADCAFPGFLFYCANFFSDLEAHFRSLTQMEKPTTLLRQPKGLGDIDYIAAPSGDPFPFSGLCSRKFIVPAYLFTNHERKGNVPSSSALLTEAEAANNSVLPLTWDPMGKAARTAGTRVGKVSLEASKGVPGFFGPAITGTGFGTTSSSGFGFTATSFGSTTSFGSISELNPKPVTGETTNSGFTFGSPTRADVKEATEPAKSELASIPVSAGFSFSADDNFLASNFNTPKISEVTEEAGSTASEVVEKSISGFSFAAESAKIRTKESVGTQESISSFSFPSKIGENEHVGSPSSFSFSAISKLGSSGDNIFAATCDFDVSGVSENSTSAFSFSPLSNSRGAFRTSEVGYRDGFSFTASADAISETESNSVTSEIELKTELISTTSTTSADPEIESPHGDRPPSPSRSLSPSTGSVGSSRHTRSPSPSRTLSPSASPGLARPPSPSRSPGGISRNYHGVRKRGVCSAAETMSFEGINTDFEVEVPFPETKLSKVNLPPDWSPQQIIDDFFDTHKVMRKFVRFLSDQEDVISQHTSLSFMCMHSLELSTYNFIKIDLYLTQLR